VVDALVENPTKFIAPLNYPNIRKPFFTGTDCGRKPRRTAAYNG